MTTRQVLSRARRTIQNPERWTKGTLARDRYGTAVVSADKSAYQWCAVKALLKAMGALRTIRSLNVPGDVLDLAGEHKRVADEALREIGPPHKIGAAISIFHSRDGKR